MGRAESERGRRRRRADRSVQHEQPGISAAATSRLRPYEEYSARYRSPFIYNGSVGCLSVEGNTVKLQYPVSTDRGAVNLTVGQEPRAKFAVMNQTLYIFPAKQAFRTSVKNMEASVSAGDITIGDGTYAGEPATLNTITAPSGVSWTDYFRVGDAVEISGCVNPGNNKTAIIREITSTELRFYENTFAAAETQILTLPRTIARTVPDMDFVFVNENRMWGCKGDTIYASKLGDPLNWSVFDGLSTDSWTATTGTDGNFTAGCSFRGYPTFFKENAVFQVMGDRPENFSVKKASISGVASFASGSVVEIRNNLLYYSVCGFVMWNGGGSPTIISRPLGLEPGKNTIITSSYMKAGSDGIRYYVTVWQYGPPPNYYIETHDYVYDTRYGTWHEIEHAWSKEFAWDGARGLMLALKSEFDEENETLTNTSRFYNLAYPPILPDTSTEWRVTFADSTRAYKTALTGSESKKGVLRLLIRCRLAKTMKVWIAYDGGDFEEAGEFGGEDGMDKGSRVVPLILRRCDYWQLRLTGVGDAVIYSIAVERYGGEWQQA